MPFSSTAVMPPHHICLIAQLPTYDAQRRGMSKPKPIRQSWSNLIQITISMKRYYKNKFSRTVMTKKIIYFDDQMGYDFNSLVNYI